MGAQLSSTRSCLPAALWPSCVIPLEFGLVCWFGSRALNPIARQESLGSVFGTAFQLPFRPNTHKLIRGCSPRLVTRTGARTSVSGTVSGDALEEGMAGLHNSSLQEAGCTLSTGYGLPVDLFKPFPHLFMFH